MTAIESGQSSGVVEVTPSGIPVYYQSQPKRLYRVFTPRDIGFNFRGTTDDECNAELLWDAQNDPRNEWREVPSVTTVLGVLDKPALPWWGMKTGVEGMLELFARNALYIKRYSSDYFDLSQAVLINRREDIVANTDKVIAILTKEKLTVNHVRDKAGDRGQAVHDALENWARYGHRPDPSIYPEEQEGYVRGLLAFLDDVPSAEPEGAEVLVASVEYGYAGRYDLRLRTNEPHEVVVRRTKTKVRSRTLLPGRLLADLKTSAGAYPSHALQLAAYEQASIESGYEPTDGRGVLIVTKDGFYEFKRTKATADDFHAVLEVYNRMQNKKEWL